MAETALAHPKQSPAPITGWQGIAADWSSDQRAFKNVSWGKAMMWIFLLSDTFIFSCFLLSYMTARMSTTVPWPNPSEVFALTIGDKKIPLILIAIMTFVLISSSGTMAMAVNFGYRRAPAHTRRLDAGHSGICRDVRRNAGFRMDQADHGGRPALGQSLGRGAVWFKLFHDYRLPRHPRDNRRDFPDRHRAKGLAGGLRCRKARLFHEQEGALRDRRNHRPVLALRRSCVGVHLCLFLSLVRSAHDKRSGTYRRTTFAARSCA